VSERREGQVGDHYSVERKEPQLHLIRSVEPVENVAYTEPAYLPCELPLVLEVSAALVPFVDPRADGGRFCRELMPHLREQVLEFDGVPMPGVRAREGGGLGPWEFRVLVEGAPVQRGSVGRAWRRKDQGLPEYLALRVAEAARRHARAFVGVQEVHQLLQQLSAAFPKLVEEVVPNRVSLLTLCDVLGRLLDDGVPIRDLRSILQAAGELVEYGGPSADAPALARHVRLRLRGVICHRAAGGRDQLEACLVAPKLESAALESDALQRFAAEAGAELRRCFRRRRPVVLTTAEARPGLQRLCGSLGWPRPMVLSHDELVPGLKVKVMGRIGG
jgi:flagellar biosynthesis component FlhA